MKRRFGCVLAIVCAMTVSACADERKWVPGQAPGEKIRFEPDFSVAFRRCVSMYDIKHLTDLDNGREYQEPPVPVIQCMRGNGWLSVPKTLYGP